ncbi:MAG: c-type cytochrome [Thermodesulfobacteriota bacterium]
MVLAALIAPSPCLAAESSFGARLFSEPGLAGSTNGKSCLTCHEGGRDLSPATLARQEYTVMGNRVQSLAEAVNFCIEVTLRGEALAETSAEMKDLLAYLRVFIAEQEERAKPGRDEGRL